MRLQSNPPVTARIQMSNEPWQQKEKEQTEMHMHQPRLELGPLAWEASILPLNHWCCGIVRDTSAMGYLCGSQMHCHNYTETNCAGSRRGILQNTRRLPRTFLKMPIGLVGFKAIRSIAT